MITNEITVMLLWLGLSCILYSSAQETNGEIQLRCDTSIKIHCPSVTSREGDVIQHVVKRAPVELKTVFSSIASKSIDHIVCREPDCLNNPCLNGGTCKDTFEGFNCLCADGYSGTRCDTSLFIQSVSLHGSNRNTSEGKVGFTARGFPAQVRLFTSEAWSMHASHLTCKHLGHSGASATVSGNVYSPDGPDDSQEYGAIRCNETAVTISDCWYEQRESDGVSLDMIIAVVCCTSHTCGPKGEPLGIRYQYVIPDSAITESSCRDNVSCGSAGRLYSSTSWVPDNDDFASPWVQIFLNSLYIITGVVTQGRNGQYHWVTSYTLSSSLDNDTWFQYKGAYSTVGPTVFPGNYRISSRVEQTLYPPLIARFIRLHPRTYRNTPSLRFELRGFGPLRDYIGDVYEPNFSCAPLLGNRLGVANSSVIPDSSFSASSYLNQDFRAYKARLLGPECWGAGNNNNPGWWIKIDLGTVYHVTGVITQGRRSINQWTTSYKLTLSLDDAEWTTVTECGSWKEFPANFDEESLVTNLFPSPLSARFVKLHPSTFFGYPVLRCEILGY